VVARLVDAANLYSRQVFGLVAARWTSIGRLRGQAALPARKDLRSWLRALLRVGGRNVDSRDFAAHGAQVCAELTAVVDRVLDG